MMKKNNDKRVLRVELNDDVKRVSITGMDASEKVVMRQELNDDDLDQATGGMGEVPCPRDSIRVLECDVNIRG